MISKALLATDFLFILFLPSVYCCPSGRRYEGEWKDGLKHGKGVKIWANGDRYEGTLAVLRGGALPCTH
jgi:hypothetical protein